jgi:hypothetical protein
MRRFPLIALAACGADPAPRAKPAPQGYALIASDRTVQVATPSPDAAIARPPPPAPFLGDVTQLSVGPGHVCAVTTAHTVVCWGDNSAGQLGVGTSLRAVGDCANSWNNV